MASDNGTATTNATNVAQSCSFWRLPLELQAYEFAFGEDVEVKCIDRYDWEGRHKPVEKLRRASVMMLPPTKEVPKMPDFPDSPLAGLAVSKRFLDECVRHWAARRTFTPPANYRTIGPSKCLTRRLIDQFLTTVKISNASLLYSCNYEWLVDLPRLSSLTLDVVVIRGYEDPPWEVSWNSVDIIGLPGVQKLLCLRGLSAIKLQPRSTYFDLKPEHIPKWQAFCGQVESILARETLKPKDRSTPESGSIIHILEEKPRKKSKSASRPLTNAAGKVSNVALRDQDIPETPNEFVQLFLKRPGDVLAWTKDIRYRYTATSDKVKFPRSAATLLSIPHVTETD